MDIRKVLSGGLISTLILAGSLVAGFGAITWADSNPGLTIFSGVDRKDILDYYLQFGGRPNQWDRYKLYIPAKKMTQGASTFFISYPDYFDGKFDTKKVEVRVGKESLPLKEVVWDQESRILEISLAQAIDSSSKVEIVLSNVKNPDFGTYYLVCDALAAGDIPVRLYLGTWIVSIEPN